MRLQNDHVYKLFDPTRGTWLMYVTAADAVATAKTLHIPYSEIKSSLVPGQSEAQDEQLKLAIAAQIENETHA